VHYEVAAGELGEKSYWLLVIGYLMRFMAWLRREMGPGHFTDPVGYSR
jgi:hypothetical protein